CLKQHRVPGGVTLAVTQSVGYFEGRRPCQGIVRRAFAPREPDANVRVFLACAGEPGRDKSVLGLFDRRGMTLRKGRLGEDELACDHTRLGVPGDGERKERCDTRHGYQGEESAHRWLCSRGITTTSRPPRRETCAVNGAWT